MSVTRTHRTIAGACMILAPLLLLVSAVIQPGLKDTEVGQFTVIATNLDSWFTAQVFAFGAIALAIPAVLGAMHMLRERQPVVATVGGALALLGLLALTGSVALNLLSWQMMRFGVPVPTAAAILEDAKDTLGIWLPLVLLPFAFGAGVLLLGAGLAMARVTSPIMGVLVAIGGVLVVIAYPIASGALAIVAAAVLLVGLGATGLLVLRETDTEWEHTPQFHGFRPAGPPAGA